MTTVTEAPPPFPPDPNVQTTAVADDRPCVRCAYNLRGQTATWNRRESQWRATCPECGSSQAIAVDAASQFTDRVSWPDLVRIVTTAWVGWHAAFALARAVAWMMSTPTAVAAGGMAAAVRAGVVPRGGASSPNVFDADGYVIVSHLTTQAIPLGLAGSAVGALAWAAPFARGHQRLLLALTTVGIAWLVGVWANLSGFVFSDEEATATVYRVLGQLNGGRPAMAGALDWQWKLASALASLLVATLAARAGLAVGGPLARLLRQMFLPGATAREPR